MRQLNQIRPPHNALKRMHSKTICVLSKSLGNEDNNVDAVKINPDTVKIKINQEHNKVVTEFYTRLNRWNDSYAVEIQVAPAIDADMGEYITNLGNTEVAILATYLCYSSGSQNAGIVQLVDSMLDKQQLNGLKILNIFIEKLKCRLLLIQINKLNSINADQHKLEKIFITLLTIICQLIANITKLNCIADVDVVGMEQELERQLDSMIEYGYKYRALLKGDAQSYVEKHHQSPFALGFAEGYIKNSSPLSRELALYGNPEQNNVNITLYNNVFRVAIATLFAAARDSNIKLVDSSLDQLILIHKKYCLHVLKQHKQSGSLLSPTKAKFIKKFLGLKRGNTLVVNLCHYILRRDTHSLAEFKKLQLTNVHQSDKVNTQKIHTQLKEAIAVGLEHNLPLLSTAEVKTAYKVFLEYNDYQGLAKYLELLSNKIEQSHSDEFKHQISQIIALVFKKSVLKAGLLDHLKTIKKTTKDVTMLAVLEQCITMAQKLLHHHDEYNNLMGYQYSDFMLLLTQKAFLSKQSFLQASTIIAYTVAKNNNLSLRQKNSLRNFMLKQFDNQENHNFTMLHKKRAKSNFIRAIGIGGLANGCSNLKYDILAVDNSMGHNNKDFGLEPKVATYGLSQLISTLLSGLLPNYYNAAETCTSRSIKQIWSNYLESEQLENQDEITQNSISQDEISQNGLHSEQPFEVLQHKIKSRLDSNQIDELIDELEAFDNKVLLYSVLTIKFNNYCPLEQLLLKTQQYGAMHKRRLLDLFLIAAQTYSVAQKQLNIGDNKNLIGCESWSLNEFFNYVATVKPQNSHAGLVESVLILAIIEGDSNLPQQLIKRRHFNGIITRLADNRVSHFKPLRQYQVQRRSQNKIMFRALVATLATVAGMLLVASGVGTAVVMGVFLIIGICKSILNSMSEALDYGNTAEYTCIWKLLDNEDNILVNTVESKKDGSGGRECMINWQEVLRVSAAVIDIIPAPCEVKEEFNGIISEARHYGRMVEQESLTPNNKSAPANKNYSATYPPIKQALKLANKGNLSQENIKIILLGYLTDDISYFTQLDREYLDRINMLLVSANHVLSTDIEAEVEGIFLEIQNQVIDKYTATQAIFRWVAILYSSDLPEDNKSNLLKKLFEQLKHQEHSLAKILLQHKNISGKRKYFMYDVVIGAATGFIDMVGLHVFDFSSVGQMAISGAASSINTLVELSRKKDTQKIKTQSFKNVLAFLNQMVLLNEPTIMEA